MSRTLYILGNGFDLAHGLETSYEAFYLTLKRENESFLTDLIYFFPSLDCKEAWRYFEEELGNLTVEDFIDSFEGLNVGSDEFRDRDYHQNEITVGNELWGTYNKLRDLFSTWIKEASNKKVQRLFEIEDVAIFFSFNYTETLEKTYGIQKDKILHIHHKLEDSDLIFGHNISSDEWRKEYMPDFYNKYRNQDIDEEPPCEIDYAIEAGCNSILGFYQQTRKEPQEHIKSASEFFRKLRNVDKIVIMGVTLCNGDAEYIQHLTTCVEMEKVKWVLYYHKESEKHSLIETLINAGVSPKNLEVLCSVGLRGRF